MRRYDVKLNAWTDPCIVEASTQKSAAELALRHFPTCDCCGAPTKVESVTSRTKPVHFYQTVIIEVKQ